MTKFARWDSPISSIALNRLVRWVDGWYIDLELLVNWKKIFLLEVPDVEHTEEPA